VICLWPTRDEYSDKKAALGDDIETREQAEPLIGHAGHHVAAMLDRPQLEREHRAQCVTRRDHVRAGEARRLGELLEVERDEPGNEQEQATARGREAARGQRELSRIGGGLDSRTATLGPLLVETAWQRTEPFGLEHLANRRRAQI